MFSKVIFDETVKSDIARVNRADRTLYLNPSIWNRLTGLEREFVLLHEAGHLELMTADEFKANKYAVEKFAPVESLTDNELGKRIVVMSEITDPAKYLSGNFFADIGNAIGTIGTVSNETFKIFGIGSKRRIEENKAANKAALQFENAKSSNMQKLLIVGGMLIVVVVIIIFVFKK